MAKYKYRELTGRQYLIADTVQLMSNMRYAATDENIVYIMNDLGETDSKKSVRDYWLHQSSRAEKRFVKEVRQYLISGNNIDYSDFRSQLFNGEENENRIKQLNYPS